MLNTIVLMSVVVIMVLFLVGLSLRSRKPEPTSTTKVTLTVNGRTWALSPRELKSFYTWCKKHSPEVLDLVKSREYKTPNYNDPRHLEIVAAVNRAAVKWYDATQR